MKIFRHIIVILFSIFLFTLSAAAEEEKTPWEYGTVTGQARLYYFTQRNKTTGDGYDNVKESLAIGGYVKYETPWIGDRIGAAVALYGTAPTIPGLNKSDQGGTGLLTSKNHGFVALGEAYLKAKFGETEFKLWRQRIDTPFINSNDSRMLAQTYEAYGLQSKDLDDAVLSLAWVDKEKARDTELFKSMTELAGVATKKGGVFMAGADWNPMDKLATRFWNYYAPDMDNTFFTHAKYTFDVSDDLEYSLLFQGVDQRSVGTTVRGNYNGAEAGLMGGVKVNGITLELGGTIVDNSADIRNSWGTYPFFNNMMSYAFNRAGEKTLYLGAAYDFSRIGLKPFTANIKTVFGDTPDSGPNASFDRDEYTLNMNYAFDGDLKGFSILNRWSYQDADAKLGGKDGFQVRLRCQYDFQLL